MLHGPLAPGGRIELSFDRLLLPVTVVRQTFVLEALQGSHASALTPTIAYDPAARVVTVTPPPEQPFDPALTYRLVITRPSSAQDTNGLRAIDGATLASSSMSTLTFQIATSGGLGVPRAAAAVDFCSTILPMFQSKCQGATCHGGLPSSALPAEGLLLTQPEGVIATAIGRLSEEANTGAKAGMAAPASLLFAQDVPIVDPGVFGAMSSGGSGAPSGAGASAASGGANGPGGGTTGDAGGGADTGAGAGGADGGAAGDARGGDAAGSDAGGGGNGGGPNGGDGGPGPALVGNPGHSWLMYKLLMAAPPACSSTPGAPACNAGSPGAPYYTVSCGADAAPCPQPLSDAERARLANMVIGREMPYPTSVPPIDVNPQAMTTAELELVSLWIAQGASVPPSCP